MPVIARSLSSPGKGGQRSKGQERRINYRVKTGANKNFKLTTDKEKADRLISFCSNEIRPVSPTLVEFAAKDFTPDKDLRNLIVGGFDTSRQPTCEQVILLAKLQNRI